jgi:TatD DNase family protein
MIIPYVNIHTHRRTGEGIEVLSLGADADARAIAPFSIGIHPWQVGKIDTSAALDRIEVSAAAAIGEIGLDYAVQSEHDLQLAIFEAQLRIAERRRLPVILHVVRAFEPVMKILKEYRLKAVIFHGFTGSVEQAERACGAGYYLSLGRRSLASPKRVEAVKRTPLDRIFVETDEAELSIEEMYRHVAEILAIERNALSETIYNNYLTVFSK